MRTSFVLPPIGVDTGVDAAPVHGAAVVVVALAVVAVVDAVADTVLRSLRQPASATDATEHAAAASVTVARLRIGGTLQEALPGARNIPAVLSDEIAANRRRATALVVVEIGIATLVVGVIGFFLIGLWSFLVGIVIAAAVVLHFASRAADTVRRRVGGVPADPVRHARLHNLTEGLCVAAGVPKPSLYVLDEPAPNALAYGRDARTAALTVTQGLLDKLGRVELEGVLAHELSHIKALDILPATLAAALVAPLGGAVLARVLSVLIRPDRETQADAQGVTITRYPPGLLAALEKIEVDPAPLRVTSPSIAHLWLHPPETGADSSPTFDERIEALREL